MVKFKDVQFETLGKFIRELISDQGKINAFTNATQQEKKEILKAFMTPRDIPWERVEVIPHFDGPTTVHISFPYTGDVEQTVRAIAPPVDVAVSEDYNFPEHYTSDPNAGAGAEQRANRLRAYHSRIGDYVMARCK